MKAFKTVVSGYDKIEVNNFVNDVTKEYEKMLNNLKVKDNKINELNLKLSRYLEIEGSLNKALLVAEEASNQVRKIARDESNLILNDAKRNASRIVNDALVKAERAESEAEQLKRKVIIYKRRLKQIVQEQLNIIDDIDDIDF